jgi:hypothetical protein
MNTIKKLSVLLILLGAVSQMNAMTRKPFAGAPRTFTGITGKQFSKEDIATLQQLYKNNRENGLKIINAVKNSDTETAEKLIAAGVNPNIQDKEGKSALYYAVLNNMPKLAIWLADQDINPNDGKSLLLAIKLGNEPLIKKLIEKGANTNDLLQKSPEKKEELIKAIEFVSPAIKHALAYKPSLSGGSTPTYMGGPVYVKPSVKPTPDTKPGFKPAPDIRPVPPVAQPAPALKPAPKVEPTDERPKVSLEAYKKLGIDGYGSPYQILDIDAFATKDQIQKAYKKLTTQWHPDKNKDVDATQVFQLINWANDELKKTF